MTAAPVSAAEATPAEARLTAALHSGSVWERELARHLEEHLAEEGRLIKAYEELRHRAEGHVRYLIDLVLEDEHRHHRVLDEMCNRVCGDAALRDRPDSVPRVRRGHDPMLRAELLETTTRFLAIEREDARALQRLRRELKPLSETTALPLLVELMELDTRKHIRVLEFIRDNAAKG
jgi:hypothetical protein